MTEKHVTPEEAARVLNRLVDKLEHSEELRDLWASAILEQAQGLAQGHPTPQSRIVADAMGVRDGRITVLSGGTPEALSVGSEFGSLLYPQFGPRNEQGFWLLPSGRNPSEATLAEGEKWLDQQVAESIRGF